MKRYPGDVVGALEQCAVWFEEYADMHAAKGATEKADRNRERARFARDTVAEVIGRLREAVDGSPDLEELRDEVQSIMRAGESMGLGQEAIARSIAHNLTTL